MNYFSMFNTVTSAGWSTTPKDVLEAFEYLQTATEMGTVLQEFFHGEKGGVPKSGNTTVQPNADNVQRQQRDRALPDTFRYGSKEKGVLMFRDSTGFDSFGTDTNNKRDYPNNCPTCP